MAMPTDLLEATTRRAPVTGWLLKRKSEKAMSRVLSATNRRFFTLDFDGQVLYYSHTESSKNVSHPLTFRHILGIEPLSVVAAAEISQADEQASEQAAPVYSRQGSKTSVGSGFGRLGSALAGLAGRRPSNSNADQFGFKLRTASKEMDLLCSSKEEADKWIDAIREAIALGSSEKYRSSPVPDDGKAEISTAPGSMQNSPTPRSEESPEDSDVEESPEPPAAEAAEASEGPSDLVKIAAEKAVAGQELSEDCPQAFQLAEEPTEEPAAADVLEGQEEESTVQQQDELPTLPQTSEEAEASPSPATSFPEQSAEMPAAQEPVAELAPSAASAGEEPVPELATSSASAGEVEEVVLAMDGANPSPRHDAQAWEAASGEDAQASEVQRSASGRYADKGEGLTLAQRLSQLDFSDDEDEEQPAGAKKSAKAQRAAEREAEVCSADPVTSLQAPCEKPTSVVVEACESFVQDADSEED